MITSMPAVVAVVNAVVVAASVVVSAAVIAGNVVVVCGIENTDHPFSGQINYPLHGIIAITGVPLRLDQ